MENGLLGLLGDYLQKPRNALAGLMEQAQAGLLSGYNTLTQPNQFDPVAANYIMDTPNRIKRGLPDARYLGPDNLDTPQGIAETEKLFNIVSGMGGITKNVGRALTKYEQAHAIAQKNATEMLGLPPNNTAMDRAKAMGFSDEPLYHGTTNDFPAFRASDRLSTYATDDPAIADIYAKIRAKDSSMREINAGPNVIPLMARGKQITVSDLNASGSGWYPNNLADALGVPFSRGMTKKAGQMGYDRIKVTDMTDLGGPQTQYIFPSPEVLRSRFAAFDPARVNEADLLGNADPRLLGLLALGAGGYGLAQR